MGQGQAEIALQLLRDCARSGEWLCLKNLHLVTSWLPTLEKVTFHPLVCDCYSYLKILPQDRSLVAQN